MPIGPEQHSLSTNTPLENSADTEESARDRLSDESFFSGLSTGFKERTHEAVKHPWSTGLEMAASFGVGAGLALMTRNPQALWGAAGGISRVAPYAFGTALVGDLGHRIFSANNSGERGHNLGSALFDYPLMAVTGGMGSKAVGHFASAPLKGENAIAKPDSAIEAAPVQLAIEAAPVRLAIEAAPVRPAIEAAPMPARSVPKPGPRRNPSTENTASTARTESQDIDASFSTEIAPPKLHPNGDITTRFGKDATITDNIDGSQTARLPNGDFLWKHHDDTTVEGIFQGSKQFSLRPDQYQITTRYADGTAHNGFSTNRQYLQRVPGTESATHTNRSDRLISVDADTGHTVHKSPFNDAISTTRTGDQHVKYEDGSQSRQYGTGDEIYSGADGGQFKRTPDNHWTWKHEDGTFVEGKPRISDGEQSYPAPELKYDVNSTLPDGKQVSGYPPHDQRIQQPFSRVTNDAERTTKFPDGRTVTEFPDTTRIITDSDGVRTFETAGTFGRRETVSHNGTVLREEADGTFEYKFKDGDYIKKLEDNSIEELNGHNLVKTDAAGNKTTESVEKQGWGGWTSQELANKSILARGPFGDMTVIDSAGNIVTNFKGRGILTRYNSPTPNKTGGEVYEAADRSTFSRFPDGEWLYNHPDGTLVEGRLAEPLPDGFGGHSLPPDTQYRVTTTKPGEKPISGYPKEDKYIKQPFSSTMPKSSMKETRFPDGSTIRETDGSTHRNIWEHDGTLIEEGIDGSRSIQFSSGSSMKDRPDGGVSFQFGQENTMDIRANGTIQENGPSYRSEVNPNTTTTGTTDGVRIISKHGSDTIIRDNNGLAILQKADGTWTFLPPRKQPR